MGDGTCLPRTASGEVASGFIYGRVKRETFGASLDPPDFFTMSGLTQIVRDSLIHCGGTSCKAVCLDEYIPVASFHPSVPVYGSLVSTLTMLSSFRNT